MVIDVVLTSGLKDTLVAEAAKAHPLECCGLLLGTLENGHCRIEQAIPTSNVSADPAKAFEIDPAALLAAHKAARAEAGGKELLGYYHSHPNGRTGPSPCDRDMASGDGRVWAIISGHEVTFWRDDPSGFVSLPYAVQER